MVRALLLLVALHATFNTSTTAVVSWEQPPGVYETCLRRVYGAEWPAGICWRNLPAGTMKVDLPGIYNRRWYTPAHGDRYILSFEGVDVGTTTLGEVPSVYTLYLPAIQKAEPIAPPLVYVPVLRR